MTLPVPSMTEAVLDRDELKRMYSVANVLCVAERDFRSTSLLLSGLRQRVEAVKEDRDVLAMIDFLDWRAATFLSAAEDLFATILKVETGDPLPSSAHVLH